ncbi:TMEM175 family protein [Schleiferilactobacillus perolens]|jgi:uncharacterized membrane protein|uniref:TMEM175 family protein n=1 Tax=Schleiferilactobacillus perolens TaxID=100468 RepID=UPI00235365F9|nr:TMEM175 family protein [Schleiferilactobacillus perolens]MCI2171831.1 TMEM175 family protein [Schleiferilactobacillus perolens]
MKKLKNRLDAYSDAVIAIIMTIMVLDLPVLRNSIPAYMGLLKEIGIYFISFALVANMWYQHATAFSEIDDMTYRIMLYDFLFLAVLSLMPLATNMMASNTTRITVMAYGVLNIVMSFCFRLLAKAVIHFRYTDKSKMRQVYGKIYGAQNPILFIWNLALLVIAWFFPQIAVWFYLSYPVRDLLFNGTTRQQMNDAAQLTPDQRSQYLQLTPEQMRAFQQQVQKQRRQQRADGKKAKPQDWSQTLQQWLDGRVANNESAPTTDKGMDVGRQMTREQWQAFAMAHLAKDPRVKEVQHRLRDYTRRQRQAQDQSKSDDKQNQTK